LLSELHIENLAVIGAADMVFHEGLNVISGETGAGKTILAHAIMLLLGARADSSLIRPGAAEASVEAVFTVPDGCFDQLADEIDLPDGEPLAVRRRISRDGRSRAYVGGRTATLSVLSELTGRLLAFSAQHEQRRLMMASRQLEILDDYAGGVLDDLFTEYALLFDRRQEMRGRLDSLNQDSESREREAELLSFQVAEIEAAALVTGEDEELDAERRRLLHAQELREATAALATLLTGGDGGEGLMDPLSQVLTRLEATAGVDADLDALTDRLRKSFFELEDTGRAARDYAEAVLSDDARLAEVEERLELIRQLERKYGDGIEAVNEFAAAASGKLATLTGDAEERPRLEAELETVEIELEDLAGSISEQRAVAAESLQQEAGRHLRELAFNDCGFEVRLSRGELTHTGADAAEFLVRLNPGMPPAPLAKTASGGELSRIMLAIKSAVSTSRDTATLVFDEIDAGIGGETGAAVGDKLAGLARGSQIICITHLPRIACHADAHFRVLKTAAADETVTTVEQLPEEQLVDELCRMMGSRPEDASARAHAASLLGQEVR